MMPFPKEQELDQDCFQIFWYLVDDFTQPKGKRNKLFWDTWKILLLLMLKIWFQQYLDLFTAILCMQ